MVAGLHKMTDLALASLLYFGWADGVLFVVDDKDCLPPDIRSYGEVWKTPAQMRADVETLEKYHFSVSAQIGVWSYETPEK